MKRFYGNFTLKKNRRNNIEVCLAHCESAIKQNDAKI